MYIFLFSHIPKMKKLMRISSERGSNQTTKHRQVQQSGKCDER